MNLAAVGAMDTKQMLDQLKIKILQQTALIVNKLQLGEDQVKYIIFLSFSDGKSRAYVCKGVANSIETSWKNAVDALHKKVKKLDVQPIWIKADLVKDVKEHTYNSFIQYISGIKTNYFREGISFDRMFNLAFLEQEVNANVFIYSDKDSPQKRIAWKNINDHVKYNLGIKVALDEKIVRKVYLFTTVGFFHDGTNCYKLNNEWLNNGRRHVDKIDADYLGFIIEKAANYLTSQVDSNGKFRYGHFPCFNREIPKYNILRHSSTTYSMVEAFEMIQGEELEQAIKFALTYLAKEGIELVTDQNGITRAFVVERTNDNEIKLGANAAAILAFSKYSTVFNDYKYLQLMQQLAEGINYFQDQQAGSFVHVLNFPDLSLKEKYRTIYYNGEAAFALMRLYALDKNEKWLKMVELAFDYFIEHEYWRQKDHWLSYCSNELIKHQPDRKYIEFNLKNASGILDFCLTRETTYPTLLELLMATYEMITKMKRENLYLELLESFDELKLMAAIEHRVEHQLNGLYFPEVAMYYKVPQNILWAFYIRHHSFRSRIDDIEHNISGYCSYLRQILRPNAVREG